MIFYISFLEKLENANFLTYLSSLAVHNFPGIVSTINANKLSEKPKTLLCISALNFLGEFQG